MNSLSPDEMVMQTLINAMPPCDDTTGRTLDPKYYWQVIILYITGEHGLSGDTAPGLIRKLQRKLPNTFIVEGVCDAADV